MIRSDHTLVTKTVATEITGETKAETTGSDRKKTNAKATEILVRLAVGMVTLIITAKEVAPVAAENATEMIVRGEANNPIAITLRKMKLHPSQMIKLRSHRHHRRLTGVSRQLIQA